MTFGWLFGKRRSQRSPVSGAVRDNDAPATQTIPKYDPPAYQDCPAGLPNHPMPCCLPGDPFDGSTPGWPLVQVILSKPNLSHVDMDIDGWVATLRIVAKNLPRLMKNGFHWDERNVREGESSLINGIGWLHHLGQYDDQGFYTRLYPLSDLGPDPQWVGMLEVCSKKQGILGKFRTRYLSRDNIAWASARNRRHDLVYFYEAAATPESDVNTICDALPLNGWWPRPRGGVSSHQK